MLSTKVMSVGDVSVISLMDSPHVRVGCREP